MVSAAGSFESPREYLKHVMRQCDVRQTVGSRGVSIAVDLA